MAVKAIFFNRPDKNKNIVTKEKNVKTLLSVLLIAFMITTVAGCNKSASDHNMSAAEHANM